MVSVTLQKHTARSGSKEPPVETVCVLLRIDTDSTSLPSMHRVLLSQPPRGPT